MKKPLDLAPKCATCKHHINNQCRAHPPQITILLLPTPPSIASRGQSQMMPTALASFPPIGEPESIGCGEHVPSIGGMLS